jgi:predicted transglutaminase-like cysteine proteinase
MPTHDFIDVGDVLNFDIIRGTVVTIDSVTDTCTVTVGGDTLTALLCYHCDPDSVARDSGSIEGAADGFEVGDEVIVLKRKDNGVVKVIGHTDGIRRCTEPITGNDYYIFYLDGSTLKIANCTYGDEGLKVIDTRDYTEVLTNNTSYPVTFHCKRFSHNVPTNGETITRDLYFIATSLYINPNPYTGWVNFAAANPTFELVTNNTNTQITMTEQVRTDLNEVNELVNTSHTYSGDSGGDNWRIMESGETGDCEDFALTKAKMLLDLGYPVSAIHMEAAMIDGSAIPNIGHAWLVVQTTTGDYALDTSSNSIVRNSSLRSNIGTEYICRRRQIGSNWAFISPFGWMMSSINTTGSYGYILDPLLNIFYSVNSSIIGAINFSEDNTSIYAGYEYRLEENHLVQVSSAPLPFYVNRTGASEVPSENLWTVNMKSISGGYEYRFITYTPQTGYTSELPPPEYPGQTGTKITSVTYLDADTEPHTGGSGYGEQECYVDENLVWRGYPGTWTYSWVQVVYYTGIALQRVFTNPFRKITTSSGIQSDPPYLLSPYGDTFSYNEYSDPLNWIFIDDDIDIFTSYRFIYSNYKKIYRNNVSCLSDIIEAVGTPESNLLGLVYIPSTDRLN